VNTGGKTFNLQSDRQGRRPLIATASKTASIETILDVLRAHNLGMAEPELRHQLRRAAESFAPNDPARHTFPIARAFDPAVSCIELC
jgi:hypothetical protein